MAKTALSSVLLLTIIIITTEAALPAGFNSVQDFVDAHNEARTEVGVGPIAWNSSLAKSSSLLVRYQRDKMECNFANLGSSRYGGNQLRSEGQVVSAREAVEAWVEEKQYYNHANNSCAKGRQCGTYTQVVWNKSVELGCAQTTCSQGVSLTICFYNPPGNVDGETPY
ncbi:STS14 protein [Impatiens glandulifera]|uniref:STS14 protein n=1 Tax=Impatiens glandulifera TaxID=253017 RepID=UPI001FB12423|nr:STS14 protein [Impatiens glandulifera]